MATNHIILLVASIGLGLGVAGCDEGFPGSDMFGWSDDDEPTFQKDKTERSSRDDEAEDEEPSATEQPNPPADEEPEALPEPEPEPEPEPAPMAPMDVPPQAMAEPAPEPEMVCVYSEPYGALVSCSPAE